MADVVTSIKIGFPYVNPIFFTKTGNTHIFDDSQKNELTILQDQVYKSTDRLTFQVRSYDVPLTLTENTIILRVSSVQDNISTVIGTFTYDTVNKNQCYSFNEIISDLTAIEERKQFCIKIELIYILISTSAETIVDTYYSNNLIVKTYTEGTKLIRYANYYDRFDALFSEMTGGFEIRVPAVFMCPTPTHENNIFESYEKNVELVSSHVGEQTEIEIGGAFGLIYQQIKTIGYILACSNKIIDGIAYELAIESNITYSKIAIYHNRKINVMMSSKKSKYSDVFATPAIAPAITEISIPSTQSTGLQLAVSGNGNWYIDYDPQWEDGSNNKLVISGVLQNGDGKIILKADENTTGEDRVKQITIKSIDDPSISKVITVTQLKSTEIGIGTMIVADDFIVK